MKSKTTTSLPEDDADGDEEVPDAAEDEGPDTEHDSIIHSGDNAEEDGKEPEVPAAPPDEARSTELVTTRSPPEDDADEEVKVPEVTPDETLKKEQGSISLSGGDADKEEKHPEDNANTEGEVAAITD